MEEVEPVRIRLLKAYDGFMELAFKDEKNRPMLPRRDFQKHNLGVCLGDSIPSNHRVSVLFIILARR